MNNIEKIVADYETCRKAWEIGLKLWDIRGNFNTVFAWWRCLHDYETETVQMSEWDSEAKLFYHKMCPAPTAEEVPLPYFTIGSTIIGTPSILQYPDGLIYRKSILNERKFVEFIFEHTVYFDGLNEATARLRMAIWLIENVSEAKQWYIDNGYLKEVE